MFKTNNTHGRILTFLLRFECKTLRNENTCKSSPVSERFIIFTRSFYSASNRRFNYGSISYVDRVSNTRHFRQSPAGQSTLTRTVAGEFFKKTVPKKKTPRPPLVFRHLGCTCRTYPGRTPPRPPSVSWTSNRRRYDDGNAPATTRCRRRIRRPTTRPDGRALRTGPFGIRRRRIPARRTGTRPWPPKCRTRRRRSRPNLCEETHTHKRSVKKAMAGQLIRVRSTVSRAFFELESGFGLEFG